MAAIDQVNLMLLLGAVLLLAGIASSLLAARLGAPLLLLFLAVGMLAGEDGILGLPFNDYRSTYLVGTLALSLILFDGGLRTRLSTFRLALAPAVLLATAGVALTAALTGLAAWWLLGLPVLGALLVGSVLASTDAAAVMLLLRAGGVQVDQRVGALLEVESGLNDPMAVMLTLLLVTLLAAGAATGAGATVGQVAWFLAVHMLLGGVVGLVAGFLVSLALERLTLADGLRPPLVAVFAVAAAMAASVGGGSGLLAAYLAGLVLGNRRPPGLSDVLGFSDALTWIAQVAMFVLIGLLVTPTELVDHAAAGLVVFAALTFVARPAAVVLCLAWFRFSWREHLFAAWVGLRGSVAVLLAAIPALAGVPGGTLYFNLAFIVVLASLALQGWTLRRVAGWLGLLLPPVPATPRAVLDLPGVRDAEILAFPIQPNSPALAGPLPAWVRPLLLLSDGVLSPAPPRPTLAPGDTLYVLAEPGREGEYDRLFAAEAETDLPALGAFSVDAGASVADIAAAYGFAPPPVPAGETIAGLFAAEYGGMVGLGDRLSLGGVGLVAEAVEDGQVVRAAIDLEPTPARRAGMRLLLRRLRVGTRRRRRSSPGKVPHARAESAAARDDG
jgi:cell volume regulation protein A